MPLPFGLANLAFAITKVNFVTYILSSMVGLMPSQLVLCYVGSTLKSMSDVLANERTTNTASFVFFLQVITAFFVMYYIISAARLEMQKHIDSNNIINACESNSVEINTKLDCDDFDNKLQDV